MSSPFLTTHWTRVLAARGQGLEAEQALSDLCAAYYTPVLTFLRQSGHDPDSVQDLAHAFFARLLERSGLDGVDPQRGRFRTYLLGAVKHFVANERARNLREKRGGDAAHQPILSSSESAPGLDIPDDRVLPPDRVFDREWAVHLLDRSLRSLASECDREGSREQFDLLKPWLTGARTDVSQAAAARRLGMSEGALRVAIHRLRRRFRDRVKAEIALTVSESGEVEEELRHLITVLT